MPASQRKARSRIVITPNKGRIIVRASGSPIADTVRALVLKEGDYPPVFYIPRDDVDMTQLSRNTIGSHCPYKGDASYFDLARGGYRSSHIAWSYEAPLEAVSAIAGHIAFYPDRVISIEQAQ